jgi:hypothetical protein
MIVNERISLPKEQIKPENKPQVTKTLSLQIDAVMSAAEDIENVESVISQKKTLLNNSKDIYESDRLFAEVVDLEWLQLQIKDIHE